MTTKLYHPTLPTTVEVEDDKKVGDWTAAGWLKSEPKAVRESKDDTDPQ